MANDGLLPNMFAKVHPTRGTPYVSTLTTGIICAMLAGVLPVDFLGNLTSVGTLFAFFMVSVSVIVLRITSPGLPRLFKIPGPNWLGGFVIPGLSALASISLMASSTSTSILRVFLWMLVGLIIYGTFGYSHSRIGIKKRAHLVDDVNSTASDLNDVEGKAGVKLENE